MSCRLFEGFGGRPEASRLGSVLVEKIVFGIKINRTAEVELKFETSKTMVVMTMGKENSFGLEAEAEDFFGDEVGLVSGIDDEAVFCTGII